MRHWINRFSSSPGLRLMMLSRHEGYCSEAVLCNTALAALDHGHAALDMWVYVNQLKSVPPSLDKRSRAGYVGAAAPCNWVLDLDNVPGISGETPQDRINSLINKLESNHCPQPVLYVETSPGSFHLVYTGKRGDWTEARRYALAERAAGIGHAKRHQYQRDALLQEGGVDTVYLSANIERAKFRLPGSLNVMKCPKVDGFPTEPVVVHGYENPDYQMPSMEMLASLDSGYVPAKKSVRKARPFAEAAWKRWVPAIRKLLKDLVDEDILEGVVEFLAKNYNMLKKKQCRILQTYMAEQLKIEQYRVSRVLRRLVRDGILVQTADHIIGVKAKSYGCGLLLAKCFKDAETNIRNHDLHLPYSPGEVNDHFLTDIRVAVATRVPLQELTEILLDKQVGRPRDKVRGRKDIENAFISWLNKTERIREENTG